LAAVSTRGYVSGNLKPVVATASMLGARLSRGDFLISRSNTQALVGLVGIFDEDRNDVSFPDTIMRMHVDECRVSKSFLELVLLSSRGRLHMMSSAAGTSGSMKKINRQTLGRCAIPVPPLDAQHALLCKVGELRGASRAGVLLTADTRAVKSEFINAVLA
jgi:hypothetical protein